MRRLDGIMGPMDMSLSELWEMVKDREVGDHFSIVCSFLAHSTISAANLTF